MPKQSDDQARTKFLEALDKKRQRGASGTTGGPEAGSKVGGARASRAVPQRFQRKSGSA